MEDETRAMDEEHRRPYEEELNSLAHVTALRVKDFEDGSKRTEHKYTPQAAAKTVVEELLKARRLQEKAELNEHGTLSLPWTYVKDCI